MQADATHVDRSTHPGTRRAHSAHPHHHSHFGQVTGALRAVETFLLSGGQQTARRNAWNAVCEDRKRARDRREALSVLDSPMALNRPNSR